VVFPFLPLATEPPDPLGFCFLCSSSSGFNFTDLVVFGFQPLFDKKDHEFSVKY